MWLDWTGFVSNFVLAPFLPVVIVTLAGRFATDAEAGDYYLKGMATIAGFVIVGQGILQSFTSERFFGTLSVIFVSAGNRLSMYWSRGVLHYPNGVLVISISLFFSWLFLDLDFSSTDWPALACSVLLMVAACLAFSLFLGNLVLKLRTWVFVFTITNGLVVVLSGVLIPTSDFPFPLPGIAHLLPLTHGLQAFRHAFEGVGVASAGWDLLGELLVAVGYGTAGPILFRLLEAHAKRTGTYETTT